MTEATIEAIQARLCGIGVNSTNRLETMLRLTAAEPSDVFWPVFLDAWSGCDATWWWWRDLLSFLRRHHAEDPGPNHLRGDDRAFFDGLPDPVEVFRGCSRPRVRSVAWTTNRSVAARFAKGHRGITVPDPVIARACIPKAAVFTVSTDRKEDEVILEPRRLRGLVIEHYT